MTDNEIMRALKSEIRIAEYVDNDFTDNINIGLLKEALDLINRQKAEIDEMKETHVKNFEKWELLDRKTKQFYAELYEEAKEVVKAEAIKEFAANLKDEMRLEDDCQYDCMNCYYECKEYIPIIDELVEEMVGKNND